MKLLKRFEEKISLFGGHNLPVLWYTEEGDTQLMSPEIGKTFINALNPSYYQDYMLAVLSGTETLPEFPVDKLTSVFIYPVENKYVSPVPQIHLHAVYFNHIRPSYKGIIGNYILSNEDNLKGHTLDDIMKEVALVVKSICKPVLKVMSDDLFNWVNQILFNYSSRLIKVEFIKEKYGIAAEIRYVLPGEKNTQIATLCRRDGRLVEHHVGVLSSEKLVRINELYFKCGGYLNIRQIIANEDNLKGVAIMKRIAEMKNTGYPNYAILQNGIAVLSNLFVRHVNTDGLSSFERDILKEALDYTPWIRR